MIYDYLIIGQGIAGTVLAFKLMQKNQSVFVIDNHHHLSSSKVAAGIINPITGRKYIKSWRIDDLMPAAKTSYNALEKLLDAKILHQSNIIRTIPNREAQLNWERIELDKTALKYIVDQADMGAYQSIIHPVFDYGELKDSYRVDMNVLLDGFKTYLINERRIQFENFDYTDLSFDESEINYKGLRAKQIIFCEGFQATKNPLFKYLPFQPAKGEAIIFKLGDFEAKKILRHKQFIVPLKEGKFWSGGGYEWKKLDDEPTESFRENWLQQMKEMIKPSVEIVDHRAAVRPAVKGRRPLIGNHPEQKNVYIFNGMGTKGASLVPFWADQFVLNLLEGKNLSEEVDITRFISHYQ